MRIEIICTGDEVLTGKIVNTNFSYMTQVRHRRADPALKQRVEALRSAGWSQLVIAIAPGEERAIEDWARIKRAFD